MVVTIRKVAKPTAIAPRAKRLDIGRTPVGEKATVVRIPASAPMMYPPRTYRGLAETLWGIVNIRKVVAPRAATNPV